MTSNRCWSWQRRYRGRERASRACRLRTFNRFNLLALVNGIFVRCFRPPGRFVFKLVELFSLTGSRPSKDHSRCRTAPGALISRFCWFRSSWLLRSSSAPLAHPAGCSNQPIPAGRCTARFLSPAASSACWSASARRAEFACVSASTSSFFNRRASPSAALELPFCHSNFFFQTGILHSGAPLLFDQGGTGALFGYSQAPAGRLSAVNGSALTWRRQSFKNHAMLEVDAVFCQQFTAQRDCSRLGFLIELPASGLIPQPLLHRPLTGVDDIPTNPCKSRRQQLPVPWLYSCALRAGRSRLARRIPSSARISSTCSRLRRVVSRRRSASSRRCERCRPMPAALFSNAVFPPV